MCLHYFWDILNAQMTTGHVHYLLATLYILRNASSLNNSIIRSKNLRKAKAFTFEFFLLWSDELSCEDATI